MKYCPRLASGVRRRAVLLLAAVAISVATLGTPGIGWATTNANGGRVYNPKALRVQKESAPKGRLMNRPNPQVRQGAPLRRSYAIIPDPRPATHGGSSYTRNGRYFYENPKPITMSQRNWNTRSYNDKVPNPTYSRGTPRTGVP
jgi:hypothetical protein